MCGLAGFYAAHGRANGQTLHSLRLMADQLEHRGPDDAGYWVNERLSVGLSHRRLAIQDLSPHGAQPMTSTSGRYVITFNGEVYNFKEIRAELEALGFGFRGQSDTEVMLAAFEQWGLKQGLSRLVGMFAFALCDCDEGVLYL